MLSKNQLANVCLLHSGEDQCRYLAQDDHQYDKWYCMKCRPVEKAMIDEKVAQEQQKQNGQPIYRVVPFGDNCDGYPVLKNIMQGYDC